MLRVSSGVEFVRMIIFLSRENIEPAYHVLPEEFHESFRHALIGGCQQYWIGTLDDHWQYYMSAVGELPDSVELSVAIHRNMHIPGFSLNEVLDFERQYPVVYSDSVLGFTPDCRLTLPVLHQEFTANLEKGRRWNDGVMFDE